MVRSVLRGGAVLLAVLAPGCALFWFPESGAPPAPPALIATATATREPAAAPPNRVPPTPSVYTPPATVVPAVTPTGGAAAERH
jgi:hypothetical protein